MHNALKYTAEQDDFIRNEHAKGTFYEEIARLFNIQFNDTASRRAIVGRAYRLKLDKREPNKSLVKSGNIKSTVNPRPKPKEKPVMVDTPVIELPLKADAYKPLPGINPVGITELTEATCRWPIDGEVTLYCGDKPTLGSVYCLCHRTMSVGKGTESERKAVRILERMG